MNGARTLYLVTLCGVFAVSCGSRYASDGASAAVVLTDAPLYQAIREGDLSRVQSIVAGDPEAVHRAEGTFGETPLHEAVVADQVEVAKFLIETGADVNAMDQRRTTPLTAARDSEASDAMIRLLEDHGAED